MTTAFKKMLNHPSTPEEARQAASLPPGLLEELSDDSGAAAAARHRERLVQNLQRARARIDEFKPDFLLVWGDDQYENFKETVVPPFCVLAADEFVHHPWKNFHLGENVWGEDESTTVKVAGHKRAAKHLVSGLLESNFDVSYSYRPNEYDGLPHAFNNTVLYLDYARQGFPYSIVPMSVNCYGRLVISAHGLFVDPGNPPSGDALDPPSPTPGRCFDLGRATARILAESEWRVALVASASWSHGFLTTRNGYLYPDVESDRKLFAALEAGDYETWRSYPLSAVEQSGQQEMLNWHCLMGAMCELGMLPQWTDFVETYVFNSTKVFALFG